MSNLITNLFSGGASELVKSIGDTLDKCITTKEEKMQLELEMEKARQAYEIEKDKIELESDKVYLADTQSARDMNVKVQESANASWLSKNVTPILALGATALTFVLFVLIINKQFPTESKDIVIYLLGALNSLVIVIFSYYFGSSKGAHDNREALNKALSK